MKRTLILVLFLGTFVNSFSQKVAGFFPDWVSSTKVNEVQYNKLTDIYFAFMNPASNGTLTTTTAGSDTKILSPLATKCQQNGVKLHLSVGGANHSSNFSSIVGSATNRTNFVNSMQTWIEKYKLDGINIDWEFPAASNAVNLALLMKEIRTKLDAMEKTMGKKLELSAAVAPLLWNSDGINADFLQYCDFVHIMAFDSGGNCCVCGGDQHSSYEVAERALQKWTTTGLKSTCGGSTVGKNVPASKLVLAIPFYSGSPYTGYNVFSNSDPKTYFEDADGIVGQYDYNSRPMIEKKVKLIMEQYKGAGVWAWELSQDRNDQYSLLGAMWTYMQPYMQKCEITEPNLGENVSICGANSVQLKSNVATDGKLTFTWFKGTQQLTSSKTTTNYTASSIGVYKVVVSNGTCEKESSVEVIGTLPTVNLGDDITLCNPIEALLDAKVQGAGIKYTWKKDAQVLDAITQTLKVTQGGTYQVTISATNCGTKSDEIKVTSALLPIEVDKICKNGQATIKVLENNGPYEWFSTANATNSIFEGTQYQVSPTKTTTYYVQKKETFLEKIVGLSGNSKFTTDQALSHFNYQKLEVKSDLTLQTVKFKAGAQGSFSQIKLLDANKTEIASSVAQQYTANQEVTITFNKDLKAGIYYITSQQWGGTVKYNATSATYTETNVMTIYPEEDYTTTATGKYGFLYDITVKAGFKNTCAKTPVTVEVDQSCVITNQLEQVKNQGLKMYPNPTHGKTTIEYEAIAGNVHIELMNVLGNSVKTLVNEIQTEGIHFVEFDAMDYSSGIYFLQFSDKNGTINQKLIIE